MDTAYEIRELAKLVYQAEETVYRCTLRHGDTLFEGGNSDRSSNRIDVAMQWSDRRMKQLIQLLNDSLHFEP